MSMKNLKLSTKFRTDLSKSATKAVRKNDGATGTVYGRGTESASIEIALRDLITLDEEAKATGASIIDLVIEGAPSDLNGPVVLKTFTKNPISRKVIDVEFQRISMDEEVTLNVPVVVSGEAPGLEQGGILDEPTTELRVRSLPALLPGQIDIDVSGLQLGDRITVADIVLEEGVEILHEPDTILAACVLPQIPELEEEEVEDEEEEIEGVEETEEEETESEE